VAALEGLTQRLESGAGELAQLVEEEDATVRQRDLPWAGARAPADEARGRDRVVRRPKRPFGGDPSGADARDAVDAGDLDRLVERRRRKDAREAAGQHRLPHPGRPDHQQVVPAGRGDLERAARVRLPADVGEVGARRAGRRGLRAPRGIGAPAPVEKVHDPLEALDPEDVEPVHQGGLGGVRDRHDQLGVARPPGPERHGQGAEHRSEPAAQGEFAAHRVALETLPGHLGAGREEGDGERQIERGAGLAQVRRGEIGGDPLERELAAGVEQRGAHPFPRLAHARVREPDDREDRKPSPKVHLDGHLPALDALQGEGGDAGEHPGDATAGHASRHRRA